MMLNISNSNWLCSSSLRGQFAKVSNGAKHVEKGIEIAVTASLFLLPGPEDAAFIALVESTVVKRLGAQGIRMFSRAGKWVFEKAGKELFGVEEKAAMQLAVKEWKAALSVIDDAVATHAMPHWPGRSVAEVKRIIANVRANWRLKYTAPDGTTIYLKGDIVLIQGVGDRGPGTIFRPSPSALQYYQNFIHDNPGGV